MITIILVPGGPGIMAGYLREVPFPAGTRLMEVAAAQPADMIGDLVRRCAAADGECVLFGHSAGVAACLMAADRMPAAVKGVVLACGQVEDGIDSPELLDANLAASASRPWGADAARALAAEPDQASDYSDDELRTLAIANLRLTVGGSSRAATERFFAYCAGQWDMTILRECLSGQQPQPDLTRLARLFPVPTLTIHGEQDPWAGPASGHALHLALPRNTLRIIPGAGHLPWLDNRAEVRAALAEFIGRVVA
jgi:proline iminopeptidase